ncbi:MAG: hypothetical protein FWF01_04460 [Alphaproteobacteria bacterium]|nr:hypothetical protein [Alphaproteobacteria bacterium]
MKNKNTIVTAGINTDIDVLACVIAYAELLEATAVIPGEFNATIPPSVRKWGFDYEKTCPEYAEKFILVDVSDPGYLAKFVQLDKVLEVWDHRPGFEKYWGAKGRIENVGACATQIFELFKDKPPATVTANLLYTAIFANTFNFKASVTTERDVRAFGMLKSHISLPNDWIAQYYKETSGLMLEDIGWAIKSDLKQFKFGAMAQLELWDASRVVGDADLMQKIYGAMSGFDSWAVNIPSISQGINYIITPSDALKTALQSNLGAVFTGDVCTTGKLYLRKELMNFML